MGAEMPVWRALRRAAQVGIGSYVLILIRKQCYDSGPVICT